MKRLTLVLFLMTMTLTLGVVGNNTSSHFGPECVVLDQVQHFTAKVDFASPDNERLIFAQFKTGDFWDIGAVQDPAAVDVQGTWHHQVNGAGNVISWWFTRASGLGGGDVGNGGSITFRFDATAKGPHDLDVSFYIEGDTNGGPPHTKSWTYTYPECADDDDDDDTTDDDDDADDDAADDDAADDDAADDDTADDDAADDDTADDDTADDDDDNGDDDDDDDDSGCGC